MKKFGGLRIILLLLLFSFITVNATVRYVHPDSTLNSIQAGIDLSSDGDTVLVAKGTYIENIEIKGLKAIIVMSESGRDSTIIDGGSPSNSDSASVVTFVGNWSKHSVLDGFTITGGTGVKWSGNSWSGGGIYCYNSSPNIINNIIYGNSPYTSAGGIACWYSSNPTISNNIIKENSTVYGGGIEIAWSAMPKITNNTIFENTAYTNGGGINIVDNASPTITSNTITANTAPNGGGIFCGYGASGTIDSCDIKYNLNGGGVCCAYNGQPVINYNNIVNNQGYAVRNYSAAVTVNAEYNWWGHATGPYHPDSNPGGLGDTVSNYVDFDPWLPVAGVEEEADIEFLYISGCYPNPFMERTQIEYNIPIASDVDIAVYNIFGARVKSLLSKRQNAGIYTINWNGRDERDNKLPSGLYFLRLEVGVNNETRKLLLVR